MNEMPEQEALDRVSNWCRDAEDNGESNYPGMTYEQGILAAIDWIQGYEDDPTT